MNRLFPVAGAVALGTLLMWGCDGGGSGNGPVDAGIDANDIHTPAPIINVSGMAALHPDALAWMNLEGRTPPSLEGLTVAVEEPLKAAAADPDAVFGTDTLGPDATFLVGGVDTAEVVVGVTASVLDENDGGTLVPARTSIYDPAIYGTPPLEDLIGVRAWALPDAFHDQLTQAVGTQRISGLTFDGGVGTLIEAGFILGKVVDAQGQPVLGAVLSTGVPELDDRIFYPNVDFTDAFRGGTNANGLFVYVHSGVETPPETFMLSVEGNPDYKPRNAAATRGSALLLTLFPGANPPPNP